MHRLQALPFPTDLTSLASIETCIVEKFDVLNFGDLGNGSFLGFIAQHSQLREELGQGLVGAAPQAASMKKKVLRILSQLSQENRENEVSLYTDDTYVCRALKQALKSTYVCSVGR